MSTPILSSRFFKDHQPSSALYQKWREIYSWSHQCLPVYEWDGVLFIGCMQIPTDFPEQVSGISKVVFVLCSEEALKTCWHEFEGTVVMRGPRKENDDHTRIPGTPILKPSDEPVIQVASDPSQPFDLNDSDHSLPSFKVDLSHEKLTSPKIKASEEEYPPDRDSDRSINIAALQAEEPPQVTETPSTPVNPAAVSQVTDDDPSSILVAEAPEEDVASEAAPQTVSEEEAPSNEAAPEGLLLNSQIEAPKFDADVLKTMTSIKIDRTETSAPASAASGAPAQPELKKAVPAKTEVIYTKPGALSSNRELAEKHEITRTGITASGTHRAANKLADVVSNVFTEMAYHYQKSMILLAENEEARPWKWSEQFHPGDHINTISFATPNPFRIVSRSQKSYHGYVVPNESNDKFFEEWNDSKTPDHLTVAPILIEENLVGFLLGIGDKSADNKNSLMLTEKLANDVSMQIKRDPLLLKAA